MLPFEPDERLDDLEAPDFADELRAFVVEPRFDFDWVDFLVLELELPDRAAVFEPEDREAEALEPVFEDPDERPEVDFDVEDFFVPEERDVVDFFNLEEDAADPFARDPLPDLAVPLVERPAFDAEPLDADPLPDLELADFDPLAERLDVDLLDPDELFEPDDLPAEPDLAPADFLDPEPDPVDFFDPDDDFDPEDFFDEVDFDPDDFLVAAITVISRFSFLKYLGRHSTREWEWPSGNLDHSVLSSLY